MKKLYWVSNEYNFKRRVILFENDKPVTVYEGFEADNFIEQAEKEGYVEGYLPREIRKVWNRYKSMLDKKIDYGDSPWDVEIVKQEFHCGEKNWVKRER